MKTPSLDLDSHEYNSDLEQRMKNLFIILYITALAFMALYVPQPLLPLLSEELHVSTAQISLLISVTLLPLSLAPILYGFILESVPSKAMLKVTILWLAFSELAFLMFPYFWILVLIRFVQGLLLPAIFTALVTYLSMTTPRHAIQRVLSFYISATIFGGFLGRFLAGILATYSHWQFVFVIIMLGLLWGYRLLYLLESDSRLQFARPTAQNILSALRNPFYNKIYLIIFLIFFCFASILNTLPFRLTELQQQTSELTIALMYAGYLIGIVVVLNSGRINRWCMGESNSVLLGAILFLSALLLFNVPNIIFMFFNMFLLCAGMFLVHSVLAGYLNHLAVQDKGIVNGLYIALYYAGGAAGSFFPGLIYRSFGWHIYLLSLCCLVLTAMIMVKFLPRAE